MEFSRENPSPAPISDNNRALVVLRDLDTPRAYTPPRGLDATSSTGSDGMSDASPRAGTGMQVRLPGAGLQGAALLVAGVRAGGAGAAFSALNGACARVRSAR